VPGLNGEEMLVWEHFMNVNSDETPNGTSLCERVDLHLDFVKLSATRVSLLAHINLNENLLKD
jgi:hypothetical protein